MALAPPSSSSSTPSIVVGGTDHAVYRVAGSASGLSLTQTLYTKTAGHTEWVTCVAAAPDDTVVSGGMDSYVMVWPPRRASCMPLFGHEAPITQLALVNSDSVLSASYDGTILLHNLNNPTALASWGGDVDGAIAAGDYMALTRNPILGLAVTSQTLWASTKDGRLLQFARNTPSVTPTTTIRAHRGATRIAIPRKDAPDSVVTTAGNLDGAIKMFDTRIPAEKGRCVRRLEQALHRGGVTNLLALENGSTLVSCGGGDGHIKVIDAASLAVIADHEVVPGMQAGNAAASVYDLVPWGRDGVVAAWGDGRVWASQDIGAGQSAPAGQAVWFDAREQGICNALKSVRITHDGKAIVGAGDDGCVVWWDIP
ncbi:hypothetical protein HDU87_003453 [Geranomyces variabilis]|uniref:Uncharacterized protein n=1 Tax=Geranomyces variabilis TaxID=109894 RepID=A0AAD5TK11_9FUNG|nr:hypothetical protein HDU87_003453 [Geranomyces variabilis]